MFNWISEHALLVSDLARYAINSSFEENMGAELSLDDFGTGAANHFL